MRTTSRTRGSNVAWVVAALTTAALLVPHVAQAVGQTVSIVDGDGSSRVQVDKGKLRVGDGAGRLTVDGSVLVSNDLARPVPVQGFGEPVFVAKAIPFTGSAGTMNLLSVPKGKLFVIESVSVQLELPQGQTAHAIQIRVSTAQQDADIRLAPTFLSGNGSMADTYTFSGEYHAYAPAGAKVQAMGLRLQSTGQAFLDASISGYLTNA